MIGSKNSLFLEMISAYLDKIVARIAVPASLIMAFGINGIVAQDGHENHPAASQNKSKIEIKEPSGDLELPDVEVTDHTGRKLYFFSDLVKGKRVVINFIYTSCDGVCPMAGRHFARLQSALGSRAGKDMFLITVTTDPEVDTPSRLSKWSESFTPGVGWTLVTGNKTNISSILKVLTGDGTQTGYHIPAIFLIDEPRRKHRWIYGLSDPEEIIRRTMNLEPTPTRPQHH